VDVLAIARAGAGAVVMAWLPGYVWVRVLAPHFVGVARFVLAVALSVALMTLCLYGGDALLHIPVTPGNALAYAAFLVALALVLPLVRFARRRLDGVLS